MPTHRQIEIVLPSRDGLKLHAENCRNTLDGSISTEISVGYLNKVQTEERIQRPSRDRWDPDGSDYSLNVLLPSSERKRDEGNESLSESHCSLETKLGTAGAASPQDAGREQPSRGKVEKAKKRGRVTFYPRVRIQRVTNRKDIPKQQINDVWYSREEFKNIRRECLETVDLMTEGKMKEEEGFCIRGLEYKVPKMYKERQRNKTEIRRLVLEEQNFQLKNGMKDQDWIAKLCRNESLPSVEAAIVAASHDENAAKEFLAKQ